MSAASTLWTRFAQWWSGLEVFDFPLFTVGGKPFTVLSLIVFLALLALLLVVAGRLQGLLADRWLTRTHLDRGMRQAVASIIRYIFLVTGFLVIIQAFGINLTTLNVLAGAIGVGIGF